MSRRAPGWLRAMLADGRLAIAARGAHSWADIARNLGVSVDSLLSAKVRLINDGVQVPTLEELQAATTNLVATSSPVGIPNEGIARPDLGTHTTKPTVQVCANRETDTDSGPSIPRWPNLEAFERGNPHIGSSFNEFMSVERQAAESQAAHSLAPDGYHVKGVSTLYDADGVVRARWVKTNAETNDDSRTHVLEAVSNLAAGWPLTANAVELPQHSDDDLLCVYPMGDPHIGMLSWAPETGENFDLAIAERNLVNAVDHLALLAPPARRALIATVGDTFHSDGLSNTTTKGTRVDVDGRTRKMIDVGVRTFRRVIDRALQKHEEVEVKIAPGNHDALLSIVLQVALQQFYEREPRVRVDPSPESFLWYRFGLNLIGVNHGDRAKDDALMQAMAVDRAEDWGQTRHRRIYKGHFHHEVTKEVPGCTIDTLNTLASSDDWHRRSMYRSTRHMRMDIIHRDFGLINRHIVGIEQLMRRQAA